MLDLDDVVTRTYESTSVELHSMYDHKPSEFLAALTPAIFNKFKSVNDSIPVVPGILCPRFKQILKADHCRVLWNVTGRPAKERWSRVFRPVWRLMCCSTKGRRLSDMERSRC